MEYIGVDIGFGFTKVTNGRDHKIFKSVVGEASEIQFQDSLIKAVGGTGPILHAEIEGSTYFIGELAERQSAVRSFTLDQNQLMSRYAKTLALTALANIVEDGNAIRVVTGLPINSFRRHKDELAQLLTGKHCVRLTNATANEKEVNFTIDRVRVIPQPFGSVFNLMLNDIGKVTDRRFIEEKVGIIDVGFKTADYTICDRTQYSERGSRTSDAGISQAFKIIAGALQEKSGVNVELYRLFDAVERGSIKIRGKNFGLKRITEQAMSQLAGQIASDVNGLWADDWDIDHVVITGGGGGALKTFLDPLVDGELLSIEDTDDMRLNNVRGYRKYAAHLWDKGGQPETAATKTTDESTEAEAEAES